MPPKLFCVGDSHACLEEGQGQGQGRLSPPTGHFCANAIPFYHGTFPYQLFACWQPSFLPPHPTHTCPSVLSLFCTSSMLTMTFQPFFYPTPLPASSCPLLSLILPSPSHLTPWPPHPFPHPPLHFGHGLTVHKTGTGQTGQTGQ